MKQVYILPIATVSSSFVLGLLVAAVTEKPWMIVMFVGIELYVMARHAERCPWHASVLASPWMEYLGLVLTSLGTIFASRGSLSCVGSVMLLMLASQLFVRGLHEMLHDFEGSTKSDVFLKMAAGLLVTLALAIGLPWFHLMPMPSWQRWIV